ncbi:lipoprotein [Mesoplasma coleopterae]|uniref:lipoprotein n=1 Tax=Mesoplasma coleopterae TaxID=324078 RepID=UPI000D033AB2|nr:lipoprotein [Mesoplasma coleopterae]AVN63152.1 hypothetical protein CG000_02485 [Mesoplasma coleopterae]
MKKLLGILAATGIAASSASLVVACGSKESKGTVVDLEKALSGYTATNDTDEQEIISELQKVKGLEKLDKKEIAVVTQIATEKTEGSVWIHATNQAKLISGEIVLNIGETPAVDLATALTDVYFDKTPTDQDVIDALRQVKGLKHLEANEVSFDLSNLGTTHATKDGATEGIYEIPVKATTSAKIVKGEGNIIVDLSVIDLTKLEQVEGLTDKSTDEEIAAAINAAWKTANPNSKKTISKEDVEIERKPGKVGTEGSITVKAKDSSEKVTGEVTIATAALAKINLKEALSDLTLQTPTDTPAGDNQSDEETTKVPSFEEQILNHINTKYSSVLPEETKVASSDLTIETSKEPQISEVGTLTVTAKGYVAETLFEGGEGGEGGEGQTTPPATEESKLVTGTTELAIPALPKLDLTKLLATTTPVTNDTTNDEIIAIINKAIAGESQTDQTKAGSQIEITAADLDITKTASTSKAEGSIIVKAKSTSKLVQGEVTLTIAKITKKNLQDWNKGGESTPFANYEPKNGSTEASIQSEVLELIKKEKGLSVVTADDVNITVTISSKPQIDSVKEVEEKYWDINIQAKPTSEYLIGSMSMNKKEAAPVVSTKTIQNALNDATIKNFDTVEAAIDAVTAVKVEGVASFVAELKEDDNTTKSTTRDGATPEVETKTLKVTATPDEGYKLEQNDFEVQVKIVKKVTVPSKNPLSEVVKTTNIQVENGQKEDKDAILKALKAVNETLDDTQVEIVIVEGATTVKPKADSIYEGDAITLTVTEKAAAKTPLSEVVKTTNIQVENGQKEDKDAILKALKAVNETLDDTQVEIVIVEGATTVKPKADSIYEGDAITLTVTEKAAAKTPLSEVVKTTNIQVENGQKEDKDAILKALKAVNETLDDTQVEIVIVEGATTVKPKADSIYEGDAITLTVTEKAAATGENQFAFNLSNKYFN